MKYTVNVSAEAKRLIEEQAHFVAVEKNEPHGAAAWLIGVDSAIASLEFMPAQCSLAPENKLTAKTIHVLPIQSHLILFTIDAQNHNVGVLSFRAGWQLPVEGLGE